MIYDISLGKFLWNYFFSDFLFYNNSFFVYDNKIIFFYLLDLASSFRRILNGDSICAATYCQVSFFNFLFFLFFSFTIIIFYLLDLASSFERGFIPLTVIQPGGDAVAAPQPY